jgi:hypothetical protein
MSRLCHLLPSSLWRRAYGVAFSQSTATSTPKAQPSRYSQGGKLDQKAVECGETEMGPGTGEMECLQPGHQEPGALGTQELVASL